MKIVIVDDDILVSSALKTILEAGGEERDQQCDKLLVGYVSGNS